MRKNKSTTAATREAQMHAALQVLEFNREFSLPGKGDFNFPEPPRRQTELLPGAVFAFLDDLAPLPATQIQPTRPLDGFFVRDLPTVTVCPVGFPNRPAMTFLDHGTIKITL